jgi:hypothetical protein
MKNEIARHVKVFNAFRAPLLSLAMIAVAAFLVITPRTSAATATCQDQTCNGPLLCKEYIGAYCQLTAYPATCRTGLCGDGNDH